MRYLRTGILLFLVLVLAAPSNREEDMAVPIATQYPLFLKILSYDRHLEAQTPQEIVIGVVYQDRFRESRSAQEEWMRVARSSSLQHKINGIPVRCVPIKIESAQDLAQAMKHQRMHVLYVTPLRAIAIADIATASQAHKAITLTGVPEYVRAGIAVGIDLRKDRKPDILINLTSSKAEGANFSAQLLKLATVFSDGGA